MRQSQRKASKNRLVTGRLFLVKDPVTAIRSDSKTASVLPRPRLQREEPVPEDAIAAISPYLTEHINRFGDYVLNLDRKPPQPDYGYTLSHSFIAS